jgi:hypothetical protein
MRNGFVSIAFRRSVPYSQIRTICTSELAASAVFPQSYIMNHSGAEFLAGQFQAQHQSSEG